jgi:zinc/manganese transport system substrate-binding protein
VPDGLDPHEFEPSARDIEAINKADLVVRNGLGLEEGWESTLDTAGEHGVMVFNAADYITVRYAGPGEETPSHEHEKNGHSHEAGAPDPHLWMDPLTIKEVVAALAPVLRDDLGLELAARATTLEGRLDDLNREVAAILSVVPPEDRKLVTGHESMGYFARRYDFEVVGVIVPSLSSQAEVSAADLAALKQAITKNEVKAVFTEIGTSPAVARTIADETGVRVIEMRTHALPADGSYFTFMKDIASTIADALK